MSFTRITRRLIRENGIDIHNYKLYEITAGPCTFETLVTASPTQVGRWLANYTRYPDDISLIVGLDVEWRRNPEPNMNNPVATLQLCIGDKCLIFQILHAPCIPRALTSFLKKENVRFVGVGILEDCDKLERDYNLEVLHAVDPRFHDDLQVPGLAPLDNLMLDLDVDKPHHIIMSDWDNRFLTDDQVQYAAVDAFFYCNLAHNLMMDW